jgi:serine/threonine protein kinase
VIPELSAGTLIHQHYVIDQILGQGGFGRTYLTLDKKNNKNCVLKEFAPSNTKPEALRKARQLFEQEAEILRKLNHRQIPEFLDWFEDNGRLFIVQEFVNGKTYSNLGQSQKFSENDIAEWLRHLLEVLEYIHGKGIIHRDISPDNIMLPNGNNPKPVLIDFGVVKYAGTQLISGNQGAANSNQTRVGKGAYAPSEQLRSGKCYPNSDLYALAVTAIVLLTGKEPDALMNHHNLEWEWRSHVNVGEKLAAILEKMLQEKPSDRYQSAREVLNAIDNSQTQAKTTMSSSKTEVSTNPGQAPTQLSTNPDPGNPYEPRKPDRNPSQWKTIALIVAPILLLVSGVAALESPRIGFLCGALNNCVADKPFNESYNSAVKQAGDARVLGQNPQTDQELQTARDRMKSAIDELSKIPSSLPRRPKAVTFLSKRVDGDGSAFE